ncbi:GNAT family N-acetyltransferase [Streptomyces qinzhouensis]|uniref:GNAT family N-acetyltransferase n=1 Tax=Streptomyces qinzhouensis TaxID=2599401 RepID=A0A5B8IMN9_9ACTN|nr:GNAT family N-acetyltransferase [Streptomyces qinzhouensis]QDY78769.1 GNAT family N-acetyltransferase [Streptomyces qinzhouensis]
MFTRHTPDVARQIMLELTAVYAKVYDVPPYIGDPFFSVRLFEQRLTAAFDMKGFEVVTAHLSDGTPAGYTHGVTLTSDRAWWVSLDDLLTAEVKNAADGSDIFWLRELMVLPEHANQGIGRALHDEMLKGRAEILDDPHVHH